MNFKKGFPLILLTLLQVYAFTQEPKYTKKYFVSHHDTTEFKPIIPKKDGYVRTFIIADPVIWDTDNNNTTHVTGSAVHALICIEGQYKNDKRDGIFTFQIIDSFDHSKKYKIWEQTFVNDKLNGQWKTFNLKGTMVSYQTYKNDTLHGIARNYWIDGQSIMEEKEYFNGPNKFIVKEYHKPGVLKRQMMIENGALNGPGKRYYENGKLEEEVYFTNDELDKTRKYYHPNGQLWIEQEYKNGQHWNIIANYDQKGNKRNAGTLKNGNGTIIYYNDDGTVRETINYVNGKEQ